MNDITYPSQKTYYILKNGSEIVSYGSVNTNQVLQTIFDIFYQTTNEEDYLTELANNNIII